MLTTNMMTASRQWMSRPADERFTNLNDLYDHVHDRHIRSVARTVANRQVQVRPVEEDQERKALAVTVNGQVAVPNNWAFNQLAGRVGAPGGYLQTLPADLVADCINYGLERQAVDEIGTMLVCDPQGGVSELVAATGPKYGRIWNDDVVRKVIELFGDGTTGEFTVPGEFGEAVEVSKDNTTLYAGDRDMFLFLADEQNRIEIPNRRPGKHGGLARGFFLWNSEVGSSTLGLGTFLYDYVCCNRMVWGMEQVAEVRVRHTAGAPFRWLEELTPALKAYAHAETTSITTAIENARRSKFDDPDKLDEFLRSRFTRGQTAAIKLSFHADEERPMETLWDVVVGATAMARGIGNQDNRIAVERIAGKVLEAAK